MENTQKSPWAWWVLGAIVLIALVWWAKTSGVAMAPVAKDTGPIKIGAVAPLTGDAAVYGVMVQRAADLATEEINSAGGIDGRNIEIIWEDGKCAGTDATTAAHKLLNVDGVKFILGGACSSETLATAPLTQAVRALLISGVSTSPDITNAGDLVFRTVPSDSLQGEIMANYAYGTLNARKVAVISENTDYAQGLRKVFSDNFTSQGGMLVADETYNTGDTDFRTIITKVKAADPDFVYMVPQSPVPGELLLKQMKEAGVTVQVGFSETMMGREAIAKNPSLYEGVLGIEFALDEKLPQAKVMLNAYMKKFGEAPAFPGYTATTYDAVYVLAEAMEAVGSDPEKVATYFNTKVKNREGVSGTLNFDENGDALLGLNLRKIVNGEVTDLGAFAP